MANNNEISLSTQARRWVFTINNPMGEEIEYTFHGEICCEKCHSWIEFCIRGYEYPVGAFNYSDAECHGGGKQILSI